MFSGRDDFIQFHTDIGETCDYDAMRAEIAHNHFSGDVNFDVGDMGLQTSSDWRATEMNGSHRALKISQQSCFLSSLRKPAVGPTVRPLVR
jgi:hypothetical protein